LALYYTASNLVAGGLAAKYSSAIFRAS